MRQIKCEVAAVYPCGDYDLEITFKEYIKGKPYFVPYKVCMFADDDANDDTLQVVVECAIRSFDAVRQLRSK